MSDVMQELVDRKHAFGFHKDRHTEVVSLRRRPSVPLLVAGGVPIIAVGSTEPVTGPTSSERGSWVVASMALVGGVARVGLGVGQTPDHQMPSDDARRPPRSGGAARRRRVTRVNMRRRGTAGRESEARGRR